MNLHVAEQPDYTVANDVAGGVANSNAAPNMNRGLASEGISGSRIGTGKLITQGGNNGESTASNSVPFGNILTFLKVTLSLH